VFASPAVTARRELVVPLVCVPQIFPPSLEWAIVPLLPTAHTSFTPYEATLYNVCVVGPLILLVQFKAPVPVRNIASPHAKTELAEKASTPQISVVPLTWYDQVVPL
jgi:hypothetical protein